jgi:hypothetical protein
MNTVTINKMSKNLVWVNYTNSEGHQLGHAFPRLKLAQDFATKIKAA